MANNSRLPRFPRWVIVGLVLVLGIAAASTAARVSEANSAVAFAEGMRDELVGMRSELDACLSTQSQMELRFEELEREVARLRQSVDSLESLDARGVPQESYEEYLDVVESYNRAIPEWETEADELREQSARCRELAEAHNAQADSLRRFLVDEGIWTEDWLSDGEGS